MDKNKIKEEKAMSKKHGSKDFRFQREFAGKCERYYGSVAAYAETLSDDKSYRLESKKAYKKNKNIEEE